jgi:hypothetical protein
MKQTVLVVTNITPVGKVLQKLTTVLCADQFNESAHSTLVFRQAVNFLLDKPICGKIIFVVR